VSYNPINPYGNQYPQPAPPPPPKEDKTQVRIAIIGLISAVLVAVIGGIFGLIHLTSGSGAAPVPSTVVVQHLPKLRGSYNTGTWTSDAGEIPFSMTGIVESPDGSFSAAGGKLGFCNISISNGVVKADGTITFSIEQAANTNTNCQAESADLHGTVNADGSNPNGQWNGQSQGQSFSGQWKLS